MNPSSRRIRILRIDNGLLLSILSMDGTKRIICSGMPPDARIVDHAQDFLNDQHMLKIESRQFQEIIPGDAVPEMYVQVAECLTESDEAHHQAATNWLFYLSDCKKALGPFCREGRALDLCIADLMQAVQGLDEESWQRVLASAFTTEPSPRKEETDAATKRSGPGEAGAH